MLDSLPRRSLPFAILGVASVLGLFVAPSAEATFTGAKPSPAEEQDSGSVRVDARLESTRLIAGRDGETYARVVLEGEPAPGQKERLPLSITLVIDQSGSMSGDKIVSARESSLRLLDELRTGDRVSVVAFSSGARVLVPAMTVDYAAAGAMEQARRAIRALPATGGTDMVAGLDAASERALAIYGEERVNRVLLLSDGQPNTEDGLQQRVAALARKGIHTTTLGVGRDYNEDLMARLADAGLGNYWFIESPTQMAHIFTRELETLASVVAREAVVTIGTKGGVEVLEVLGWQSSRGRDLVAIPVGDVYGGRKSEILVRLRVPGVAAGESKELVDVKVSFHDALTNQVRRVQRPLLAAFTENQREVLASRDLDVAKKAEEVRTAKALEEASAAYSSGDSEKARFIASQQKKRVADFAAEAGASYAPAAAEMEGALDDLEQAAENKGDMAVASKRAKATARSLKR